MAGTDVNGWGEGKQRDEGYGQSLGSGLGVWLGATGAAGGAQDLVHAGVLAQLRFDSQGHAGGHRDGDGDGGS